MPLQNDAGGRTVNPDIDHIRRLISDRLTTEDNGEVGLDLSNLGLAGLPAEFGRLPELGARHLPEPVGQPAASLPETLGELTGLRRLWLDNNGCGELPPEVTLLAGLVELSLTGNGLTTLPGGVRAAGAAGQPVARRERVHGASGRGRAPGQPDAAVPAEEPAARPAGLAGLAEPAHPGRGRQPAHGAAGLDRRHPDPGLVVRGRQRPDRAAAEHRGPDPAAGAEPDRQPAAQAADVDRATWRR